VQIPLSEELNSVFVELSGEGWHVAGHLDAMASGYGWLES